ncbi:hypothetical protein [Rhizobium gallicum]|uniref:hypothetical protein n=1 Tax=Rhizobium gallicum TaxID=56730 RepID=UPI000360B085
MITFKSGKLCHAYPSFGELVAEFKRLHGWDAGVPDGLLSPSADRQISTEFVDKSHSEQFRASHHNRATMRVVESTLASRAVEPIRRERPIQLTHHL